MFYIMDEGSRISIQLPSHWKLIARDGFNGTILWKRDIADWHDQMWPLKSGPTQLTRRLIADGDRVYVTLGIKAPVSALDAATGETKTDFAGTAGAEEMILREGILFVQVNHGARELDQFAPKLNTGDQGRVAQEFSWNEQPRELIAVDVKTGQTLWKKSTKIAPLTLAADGQKLVFHDGERLLALAPRSGEELWSTEPAARRKFQQFNFGPRLTLHSDVVLYAGGDGKMASFDGKSGKLLWASEHAPSGYQSPQDLLVTQGLVWVAPTTQGKDTGIYKGRDLRTGEVKVEFPPDINTYWFHHRCYIAKATDRFIIPSRTGIELVDFQKKSWDINHWVRGGCLYGVMPCNGLVYAPPHNCACYPEAKLYGLNALAGASDKFFVPKEIPEEGRLEQGPAFAATIDETEPAAVDWPTYRHDNARSGGSSSAIGAQPKIAWEAKLTGRLTSPVVVGQTVYVGQVDQHTLHALNIEDGKPQWEYTTGGRIDSPPTYWKGRLLLGSADGWVYCLRASDGELIWRYRAAFFDRRLMAFEQLESVWPVPGSVLVQDDVAHFAVGRSSFLDNGLRMIRMEARTGKKLTEEVMDDKDPETGGDLQERLKVLQMPVGLNDIMSSDGQFVYLKSQKFDKDGKRLEIGPVSGDAVQQGGAQGGEDRHLFAPMGFLDDTWFHRSYWVYGKNFAGGHSGYFQAGKFTPSGRILVFNKDEVFGYAREAQYYRWTTPLEHQLYAAKRDAYGLPGAAPNAGGGGGKKKKPVGQVVEFENSPTLNPAQSAVVVEAWIKPDAPNGVIASHGGPQNGYALVLNNRRPAWVVRAEGEATQVEAKEQLGKGWQHVVGMLKKNKALEVYVNGELAAEGKATALIPQEPKQPLEIGSDSGGSVGNYDADYNFAGGIDEFRIFHRELTAAEIKSAAADPQAARALGKEAVLVCTFDAGNAKDETGNKNDGAIGDIPTGQGKLGTALLFPKAGKKGAPAVANKTAPAAGNKAAPANQPKLAFQHRWTQFTPLFARAMALADQTLVVLGPPDFVDEEQALVALAQRDPEFKKKLAAQDEALNGKNGGLMWLMNIQDGSRVAEVKTDFIPVFDGLAAARGRLFICTTDGRVVCMQ
jgi:outer membrane protein assembly factor BamB